MLNNNTTKINLHKPIDVAVHLYENGMTPIALEPESKKPLGAAWQKTTYKNVEDVKSVFQDAEGLGLLLNDLVVLDIDRNNIANRQGLDVAELHGIHTHKNVFGRHLRLAGAIILQSSNDVEYMQSPKQEVECLTGNKQKVMPPSWISTYSEKHKKNVRDQFMWATPPQLNDIQYVEPEVLQQTCNALALLHVLSKHYPAGGEDSSRDKATQLLCRLFKVSKHDYIDAEYTTRFINILAHNTGDTERQTKKFYKQFEKYKDCNGAIGQLQKYWDVDADVAKYILQLLDVDQIEERKSDILTADDFELESLPARRWTMYRLMPAEDVSICAGDGGTGKTQLYIQIALQSHIPQSYFCQMFPFPDTTPRIYLVSQEDTKDELKLRVAIAKAALREKYTDYKGGFSNFLFESFRQEPLKLVRKTNRGIPEVNHRDVKYLQERVGDLKLDALILDPVSTLHIGMNENDNADMDFFIRNGVIAPLCEKMKVHCTLLAHTYKGSQSNADDIQSTAWMARGATSMMAAARVSTGLNRISIKKAKEVLGKTAPQQQIFELQKNYVHWTYGKTNMSAATSGSFLQKETKKYVNKDNQTLEGMFYTEANDHFTADAEEQREEESNRVKESIVKHILAVSNIDINTYEAYEWALIDLANDLKDVEPNMKLIAKDLREQKKPESDINKSIANKLQRVFERPWQHTQHNREFAFVNMQKKRAGIIVKRWLVMRDVVDEFEQQIEDQPVISIAERLERNKNG